MMKRFMKAAMAACLGLVLTLSLAACKAAEQSPELPAATATAILIADFGDGPEGPNRVEYPWEYEAPLHIEALSNGLSATTGLDFFVSGKIEGNKAFVSWLDAGTLIAGLDDRELNEGFFFYDAVSLNWFMMDSLASTVKMNFPEVTEVYYSGQNGEPVVFSNPEDMASQGLPVLPVDLPYEGSAFFLSHAGGRGDEFWEGTFISEDGKNTLSFEDYDGLSFRFAFVSSDNSSEGYADVNPDSVEAAENEEIMFWFMDNDTLLVSGGAFEGTYIRDEDSSSSGGFDFGPNLTYVEEYVLQGDPGEYKSAAEAAKLTFDAAKLGGHIPGYNGSVTYTMTLVDLADINGEECYVYRCNGYDFAAGFAYAYQSGGVYIQGQGGQWVPLAVSSVDPADVSWWGKYNSINHVLGIANYNGKSFSYTIDDAAYGVAALDPDTPYSAHHGEMTFSFDGVDTINIEGGDFAETYFRSQY